MTDDIVAFIRARLDEDEQDARSTTPVPLAGQWKAAQAKHPRSEDEPISIVQGRDEHQPDYEGYSSGNPVIVTGAGWPDEPDNEANLRHIARHDPARVLRGVEAKRRIVHEHQDNGIQGGPTGDRCLTCLEYQSGMLISEFSEMAAYPCLTLRLMSTEWSDHADYREEWKP